MNLAKVIKERSKLTHCWTMCKYSIFTQTTFTIVCDLTDKTSLCKVLMRTNRITFYFQFPLVYTFRQQDGRSLTSHNFCHSIFFHFKWMSFFYTFLIERNLYYRLNLMRFSGETLFSCVYSLSFNGNSNHMTNMWIASAKSRVRTGVLCCAHLHLFHFYILCLLPVMDISFVAGAVALPIHVNTMWCYRPWQRARVN